MSFIRKTFLAIGFILLLSVSSIILQSIFPVEYVRSQILQQVGFSYWNSSTNAWAPFSGEFSRYSYSAQVAGLNPQASPQSLMTILGSATKTIRITRIWVSCDVNAATFYRLRVLRYSTAYTGGIQSSVAMSPHDANFPAATATVYTWTAGAPTEGTLAAIFTTDRVPCNASTMTATQPYGQPPQLLLDYTNRTSSALVVRGTSQYISVDGQGQALPSGIQFYIRFEFVEDNS